MYCKFIIFHVKHIFYGKHTCILMPWGVMGCHGVISSTDLIDYVYCIDACLPEHKALPPSHKICLQIEAVTFIGSGKD